MCRHPASRTYTPRREGSVCHTWNDNGKSVRVWGGGRGSGRCAIFSMKTVHRQEMLNGKSLRLLAFIGTHVSVARPYPHDSSSFTNLRCSLVLSSCRKLRLKPQHLHCIKSQRCKCPNLICRLLIAFPLHA